MNTGRGRISLILGEAGLATGRCCEAGALLCCAAIAAADREPPQTAAEGLFSTRQQAADWLDELIAILIRCLMKMGA